MPDDDYIKQEPQILDPNARFDRILQQGVVAITRGVGDLEFKTLAADENKPLFAINECVTVRGKGPSGHVKARAWKPDLKSMAYVVLDMNDKVINNSAILEADLASSQYALGDVVQVKAFNRYSTHVIQNVHAKTPAPGAMFFHDLGSGFQVQASEIHSLIARPK